MNQENQSKPKTFSVGDTVTWTSQANGKSKTKTGKVILLIPSGVSISDLYKGAAISELRPKYRIDHLGIFGRRDHESYLIQVGKSKRLYWPLVKYLEKVPETVKLPAENSEEGQMLTVSKVNQNSYEMEWQD